MASASALPAPFAELKAYATRTVARSARLVRARPLESAGTGAAALLALLALTQLPSAAPAPSAAPPAPPPLLVRQIAPAQAIRLNAAIPVADVANPAALPFAFRGNTAVHTQALQCLASAIYYEAGSQSDDGERAVAQVVLNRVRHPAFPASVCGVVYEGSTRTTGCQFSFTCDGSLGRAPDAAGWRRATRIASEALAGSVYGPVGWATHYHADYVVPYWASSLAKDAVVGAHIFYQWPGHWGAPAVFASQYLGREPSAAALRTSALAVVHTPQLPSGTEAALVNQIPGAEILKLAPSMRGDKRVAVRFNQTARAASEAATHQDYIKAFDASDNLKWSLSGSATTASEPPLGKSAPPAPASQP